MSTSLDSRPTASSPDAPGEGARTGASVVPGANARDGWLARTLREFGVQDYWVLAYCVALCVAALQGVPGPDRAICIRETFLMFAFATAGLVIVRSRWIESVPLANGLLYRLSISGVVQISYFFFRRLLPVANPGTLDHQLYALDLALFGVEPAMAFDHLVNPFTTEWFSFFYFGYFPLIGAHILPIVLFAKQKQLLGEFTFGLLTVFCIGHITYMFVPGFGPFHAMAGEFQNQFPPGLWHDLVMNAVSSGGAFKDIFPSIHTATPTFIALFSFRHRDRLPFRYTWLPVTLFALNIIGATMFLRWHYLIDVVAGLTLGSFALWLTVRVTRFELNRRAALGLGDSWPDMVPDLPTEQLEESDLRVWGRPSS
jgi:hypothetical protein